MNINTTVGSVTIQISDDRLQNDIREAQKKLNMQIVADCTPLIPFRNEALRGSYDFPETVYGGVVTWGGETREVPYAHYQYMGELYLAENGSSWAKRWKKKYPTGQPLNYHHPGTGGFWFDEAKKQHLDEWVNLVKETVGQN